MRKQAYSTQIIQFLFFLNSNFQASSHLLWLYIPICVGPGQKTRKPVFSQRGSFFKEMKTSTTSPPREVMSWGLTSQTSKVIQCSPSIVRFRLVQSRINTGYLLAATNLGRLQVNREYYYGNFHIIHHISPRLPYQPETPVWLIRESRANMGNEVWYGYDMKIVIS